MSDYRDLLKGYAAALATAGIGRWIDPDTDSTDVYQPSDTAIVIASLIESVDSVISLDFTIVDENAALPMGTGILSLLVRGVKDDELGVYDTLSAIKDSLQSKGFDFTTIKVAQTLLQKTLQIGDDQNNRPQMGMVFTVDYDEQPTNVRP